MDRQRQDGAAVRLADRKIAGAIAQIRGRLLQMQRNRVVHFCPDAVALERFEQAVAITSYVPKDQEPKLALIQDAAMLLGPTLSPPQTAPPPSPARPRRAS